MSDSNDSDGGFAAWENFVADHSRLLLHVAGEVFPRHDDRMDAYAFVLERLREDDCRRLRAYQEDGRSKFSTWLTVVVRRLCLDFYRQRYGRPRGEARSTEIRERFSWRRRLVDLTATEHDLVVQQVLADQHQGPEDALHARELSRAVHEAVAALHPEERLLLSLRFRDGLSAREIAGHLGLPTAFHVFRRLNATFTTLRRHLASRGVESSSS